MAVPQFARSASARKPLIGREVGATPKGEPGQIVTRKRRARLCPSPHLTEVQFTRLLAFVEDKGGLTTLVDVSRALPRVSQPISAVFDLCYAGVLCVDRESAFDGELLVWRMDR